MLLPWIVVNQINCEFVQIESDWMRSAGQITRRVGLIYPAAGKIDTPFII